MKVVGLEQVRAACDKDDVLDSVRRAFVGHAKGDWHCPPPTQILFHRDDGSLRGDCHVKSATAKAQRFFAVKVAAGMYDNPGSHGLPVNSGLVLLMSAETGQPAVLFQDEGWLTAWRTAAAGALAASLFDTGGVSTLGVVGTGQQALLQAEWIAHVTGIRDVRVYGRCEAKAGGLVESLARLGLGASVAPSVAELCEACSIVVTTTPATEPLIVDEDVSSGVYIIAMGSDSPGKQELDPRLLARAARVVVDDKDQCLHHGEFGVAVRNGLLAEDACTLLGEALTERQPAFADREAVYVTDLTGLGAQDLAIAMSMYSRIA